MNIIKTCGISIEEIYNKKYNIWIGISFSNKFFIEKNIKKLIDFAIKYSKKEVLVWVPGRMHATNYYYFEKKSRAESLQKAYNDEEKMKCFLNAYISFKKYSNITIASYDDVCTYSFIKRKDLFFREFAKQGLFYKDICNIAKNFLIIRQRPIEKKRIESISLYILQELPAMVGGLQIHNSNIHYSVLLYPGIGTIDIMAQDLIQGKKYKALSKKLDIIDHHIGVVDILV